MNVRLLVLAVLVTCAPGAALADANLPPVTYPKLIPHAQAAQAFVPAGWRLESQAAGDLNGDGRADLVLVLRNTDPRNVIASDATGNSRFDTNPRILAVAFSNAKGGYVLAVENHTLVTRNEYSNMDDYLDPNGMQAGGVAIKRGTLQVTLGFFASSGGWDTGRATFTFRFQEGAFKLIGYDRLNVNRSSGEIESTSINYETRRRKHTAGNISDDADRVTWTNVARRPLLSIDAVGDGVEFASQAH